MPKTDRRIIALIREARLLDDRFPDGKVKLKAGLLRWHGMLQPTEISRKYFVVLRYVPPQPPRVVVGQPRLIKNTNGHLPHIYTDGSLCLHKPNQWTAGDPIANTILPWTSEWLLHYEIWLATGEWCGSGGDHTGPIDSKHATERHSKQRRVRKSHQRKRAACA